MGTKGFELPPVGHIEGAKKDRYHGTCHWYLAVEPVNTRFQLRLLLDHEADLLPHVLHMLTDTSITGPNKA